MAAFRRIQQNYLVQTLLMPALITFAGATILAILAFSRGNLFTLDAAQIKDAVGMGGFAGLTYVAGIYQHGLGSASFHTNGTVNQAVEDIVTIQQAADTVPGASRVASGIATQASMAVAQIKGQP